MKFFENNVLIVGMKGLIELPCLDVSIAEHFLNVHDTTAGV